MYRVAGRGEGGNRGGLRRMTLGAYPLIDLKAAREKARAALDLADRGDDPADQRKDELRQKGERVFEVICIRFIELHAKAHTVKWRDTERLLHTYVVPEWKSKPIDTLDRATARPRTSCWTKLRWNTARVPRARSASTSPNSSTGP
jgi:hypothetical protein